jgi:hypothetical protein
VPFDGKARGRLGTGSCSSVVAQPRLKDAVGLVLYELWMLRECAHMPKPAPRVSRNLWYEGLVLHARVLRDFFFTKVDDKGKRTTRKDDIVAIDYFATQSAWPYTSRNLSAYLKENKKRMDRALAHLSFGRLVYKEKDWSATQMLSEIGAKWFEFLEQLEQNNEPAAVWFRSHRRARLIPTSPPL